MDKQEVARLKALAKEIRIETLREIGTLGFGHIGGSLSIADLLAVLYGKVMRYDPKDPQWTGRDKLIVSKGHSGPAVYATLAIQGFFPREWLKTLNKGGTRLPSHCDKNKTPGIDATTGSLGQGASQAVGIAMAEKLSGEKAWTYLILGDGELQEGQVWEAAMFAAAKKLSHLVVFVDNNKRQLDDYIDVIQESFDIGEKFKAFGFDTQRTPGDNVEAIFDAIERAQHTPGVPHAIILDTIKGQGVREIQERKANHSMNFDLDQAEKWILALELDMA